MTTDKTRALAEQIESSVYTLAAETDAVRKSEVFMKWLDAMAQFSHGSFNCHNRIAIQRPEAGLAALSFSSV
jgi:hypothetical protein